MVQREAVLQTSMTSLKDEVRRLSEKLKTLMDVESTRRVELDRMTSERQDILTMLAGIQQEERERERGCGHCRGETKVTNV